MSEQPASVPCSKCGRRIDFDSLSQEQLADAQHREPAGKYVCDDCLRTELAPAKTAVDAEPILKFFAWEHLKSEELRAVSRLFARLARDLTTLLPRCPERTVALRKLLESKDAAVRAALP